MNDEYIKVKDFKHLIGKRARFKNNLNGYCRSLWLREGVIMQLNMIKEGDLNHVGLSIVFDKKGKVYGNELDSCYIAPNSYEVLK